MKKIKCDVRLQPTVEISWPDGRSCTLTEDDVCQLLQTLAIEELLLLDLGGRGKLVSGLAMEVIRDTEGRFVLKVDNPELARFLSV